MNMARRGETSEAPGWPVATTETIANIGNGDSHAARRGASPADCSATFSTGSRR
jgi:hypothetical protein